MKKTFHDIAYRVAPWVLPVGLLVVWQLAVQVGWLSSRILPAPSAVVAAGVTLVRSGEIWQHLAISTWRADFLTDHASDVEK